MSNSTDVSRRNFLKNMSVGTGGLVFMGSFGVAFRVSGQNGNTLKGIVVDFTKCTGCRTCETICSAFNNPVDVDGESLNGLGNPWLSNIKVHWFNPDADVPMVCSLCEDAPCIATCPAPPDEQTGYKALYRDPETGTVRANHERCIGCGACAMICKNMRTGVISLNAQRKPFGMCTLCGGQPNCVKYCTYHALSFAELTDDTGFRKKSPETIARQLIKEFYNIEI